MKKLYEYFLKIMYVGSLIFSVASYGYYYYGEGEEAFIGEKANEISSFEANRKMLSTHPILVHKKDLNLNSPFHRSLLNDSINGMHFYRIASIGYSNSNAYNFFNLELSPLNINNKKDNIFYNNNLMCVDVSSWGSMDNILKMNTSHSSNLLSFIFQRKKKQNHLVGVSKPFPVPIPVPLPFKPLDSSHYYIKRSEMDAISSLDKSIHSEGETIEVHFAEKNKNKEVSSMALYEEGFAKFVPCSSFLFEAEKKH